MSELLDVIYCLGASFTLAVLMVYPRPRHIDEVRWHAGVALATALWPLTVITACVLLVVGEWLRRR
jgi:hypothetical protein